MTIVHIKYFSGAAKTVERSHRQTSAGKVSPAENSSAVSEQTEEKQAFLISQRMYEDYGEKVGLCAALPVYFFTSGSDPVALLKWSCLLMLEVLSDESKWVMLKRMEVPLALPHLNFDAHTFAYVLSMTCSAELALVLGFYFINCGK